MLHVMGARCVARDLHTISPWPLERMCWRQLAAERGDCRKSRTAPLNAIIIIIIIIYEPGNSVLMTQRRVQMQIRILDDHFKHEAFSDTAAPRIANHSDQDSRFSLMTPASLAVTMHHLEVTQLCSGDTATITYCHCLCKCTGLFVGCLLNVPATC